MAALLTWTIQLYRQTVAPETWEGNDGRLALFEIRIILARLIWEFDLELVEDMGHPVLKAQNQTTSELKVRLHRRGHLI